jgi:hypothetical protein
MAAVTFDTLQFVKDLQAKGFNSEQAEGISDGLKNALAVAEVCTKQDLKTELAEAKMEIIKWNVGTIMAAVGLTIAIVKLLG